MVELKLLAGEPQEMAELQRVLEEAPTYSQRITGHPPGAADAQSTYSALPPDKGYEDKFVFGIYVDGRMVGCADLVRAYPDAKTAMLGLLLVSERAHRKGVGSAAYRRVEELAAGWAGVEKIRIGVVTTNREVIPFWEKMGFRDTGVRKPYTYDKVESETWVFEKTIVPRKRRFSMRRDLKQIVELAPAVPSNVQTVQVADAEAIGTLQEKAYRGTIDDEGENLEQFILETRATLEGKYGPFVSDASFCLKDREEAIAATIVTIWKERPLLAFSVTHPRHQRRGLAEKLIVLSMNALAEKGYKEVVLAVTDGNPAMHLYKKLGFEIVPRE